MAYWAPLIVYYLPGVAVALGIAFVSLGALARSRQDTELASFAGFSLLGSVASLGVTYASTVVVALIADIRDAGMWATLVSAASPFLLVPRSMSMLFLPRLSRETPTDGDRFRDLSAVHQLLSSGLAAMFLGPAVILGRHVAPAVLGLQYDSRTALIWVLVCSAVYATTRGEPIVTATAALGRVRWSSGSSITVGVLVVLFWWLAAPHYATVAVATGYTAFTVGVPIILALVWWIQDRGEPRRPRLLPNLGDAAFGACLALDLLGGRSVVVDVVFAMAVGIAIAFWSWRKYRTAAGLAVLAAEVVPRTTKQPRS
jgi:O-antigen/teichoic acid export membrane protein